MHFLMLLLDHQLMSNGWNVQDSVKRCSMLERQNQYSAMQKSMRLRRNSKLRYSQ